MEIYLDRRAVRQIRSSAQEAIDEGDTESSREEILESFTEDQIEEIERRLDHGDMFEFITDVLDEWSGEDADELFDILENQLGDIGVELKFDDKEAEEEEEEDEDDEEEEDEDDDEEETVDEDEDAIVGVDADDFGD
jgi:hypothetical protein